MNINDICGIGIVVIILCAMFGVRTVTAAVAITLVIVVMASLSGCVQFERQWTPENRKLETTYQVLHAIDGAQTLQMTNRPDLKEVQSAWLLGEHPSAGKVFVWYFVDAYGHALMTNYLDEHAPRWVCRTWQAVTIGGTLYTVHSNYQLGLRVGF